MQTGTNMLAFGQLFEGAYMVDKDRTILFWNKAAENLTGYRASEVVGKHCDDNLLMHVNEKGENLCKEFCPLKQSLNDGQLREVSVFLRHKDGHRVPVKIRAIPITDAKGLIEGTIEVFSKEIQVSTEQMRELTRKAFVDTLTGLPNKEYIFNKLKSMLANHVAGDSTGHGILFIELDNLKSIQEEFGIAVGEKAIGVTARTILENLSAGNLVARWDGGLFLAITGLDKKGLLLNLAGQIRALIRQSTIREYDTLTMNVNVGGSVVSAGEDVNKALAAVEQELKNSRSKEGNISIRE